MRGARAIYSPLEKNEEQVGADFQSVALYSMNTLVALEDTDSPVTKMLEYWLELRRRCEKAPLASDFNFSRVWRMKIPNRVTITDCSADDPENFRIRHHAHDIYYNSWFYGQRITDVPFGEIPSPMLSRQMQNTYLQAKTHPNPASLQYHQVTQRVNRRHRNFKRLLLPFVDATGEVTMMIAVSRFNQPIFTVSP